MPLARAGAAREAVTYHWRAPEAAREGRHQPARNPVRRAQAQIAAAAQQWEEF